MSQVQNIKEMNKMQVNAQNFEKEVLKNEKPVVVDFWAPWCGPCKMIAPVFEKLSKELSNIDFKKVNVDDNTPLAHEQGVMGLPCMIVYKGGVEIGRIVGYHPEPKLKAQILNAVA